MFHVCANRGSWTSSIPVWRTLLPWGSIMKRPWQVRAAWSAYKRFAIACHGGVELVAYYYSLGHNALHMCRLDMGTGFKCFLWETQSSVCLTMTCLVASSNRPTFLYILANGESNSNFSLQGSFSILLRSLIFDSILFYCILLSDWRKTLLAFSW